MTLIGTEGMRALTHGRVDAAASLPPGSTSNHFRTRAALLEGVIAWMAQQERLDAHLPTIRDRDEFAAALSRMIAVQSAPRAARTRARYALFLEADDDAVRPLGEQRLGMERWVRGILRDIGGEDAAEQAAFVMATAEELLLYRITVDPQAPIDEVIGRAMDATLPA